MRSFWIFVIQRPPAKPEVFEMLFVECRIGQINIFLIHLFLCQTYPLAKTLEVDDLPFPQEADHIVDIRII